MQRDVSIVMTTRVVAAAGMLAAIVLTAPPTPAQAGWTPPQSLGSLRDPRVVVGAEPGVAAALGIDENGSAQVSAHTPGGEWGPAQPLVTTDGAAEDGVTGAGGAFAVRRDSGTVAISQVSAAGALGRVAVLANPDVAPVAVVAAPDGTLMMLGNTDADDLRAYSVAPGSTSVVRVGGSGALLADANVEDAALVATADSAFHALWTVDPEGGVSAVKTRELDAAAFGPAERTLSTGLSSDDSVTFPRLAVSAGAVLGGWVEGDGSSGGAFAQVRSISAFDPGRGPTAVAGNAAVREIALAGSGDGSVLVFAAGDGSTDGSAVALVGPDGAAVCSTPANALRAVPVARGDSYALVREFPISGGLGVDAAELGTGACTPGAPDPGPGVGDAGELVAAADAEGTLATAATDEAATTLTARDVTAPRADAITVSGPPGRFVVSIAASDAWSAPGVAWTVDGNPAGSGSSVVVSGLAAGSHEVAAVVSDSAGNTTNRTATLDVPAGSASPGESEVPATPQQPAPTPSSAVTEPRVLAARILRRGDAWLARVLISGGDRVQLTLTRERYLKRHPSPCGRLESRPHPRPGEQGQLVSPVTEQRSVRIELSAAMHRALRRQGRYTVSIVALDREGRRSTTKVRRFTVCTTRKGRNQQ